MRAVQALPIDPLLPEIVASLRASPSLVIEAPPGAGKTTRVPRALLDAGFAAKGELVVLEPRRLPTRLAARRVAEELGEEPGRTVGYAVRFEDVSGPSTKVKFVTEGILTRRLLSDPELRGVSAVLLDEFHERHLATDLALALLRRLQERKRPELRLVVMSATLEAEPIAAFLEAPSLRSEGRRFPVTIEHAERPDDRRLEEQVAGAVKRLFREGLDGDVLVFLPGAAEIRRAGEALSAFAKDHDLVVLPLHGDLPPAEQDRAVRPGPKRKVILSTNVAETSVTIEGVAAVVDSGLARVASHSPWTGLPTLAVAKISRASATQRAGRAGRTREGRVIRLYTKHDHDLRPERDARERARLDLAEAALTLHGAGVRDLASFPWFEHPPDVALGAADELLRGLGALAKDGTLTELGRRLLRFPVHPRLGRMVVEGEARGVGEDAALLAALVGERDIRRSARTDLGGGAGRARRGLAGPSDLLELLERFREAEGARFAHGRVAGMGLDPRAVEAADRARRQLARLVRDAGKRPATAEGVEEALQIATLAGFPDRVARRRRPKSRELVLSGGGSGELAEESVVHEATLVVAVDVEERTQPGQKARVTVRLASEVKPEWLLDLYADQLVETDEHVFDEATERVLRVSRISYGQIAIEEDVKVAPPSEEAGRVLARAALARGLAAFGAGEAVDRLRARLALLEQALAEVGLPEVSDASIAELLSKACAGRRSFAELREADLAGELFHALAPEHQRLLRTHAPERIQLPGGRGAEVPYDPVAGPWIESRLQDFFGMAETPKLAAGRVPLTLHLNAPSGRAVQVTQDLAGFWERHYPQLRKELMRKYPRHLWPEDGRTAKPPPPNRPR